MRGTRVLTCWLALAVWASAAAVVPAELAADCGNSLLDAGEQCDDGNVAAGDGCSESCQVEPGFSCSEPVAPDFSNLIADPGFEAGPGSGAWVEASVAFGTPICDVAVCGLSRQRSGDYWTWLGGVIVDPEEAMVAQTAVIPETASSLTFWLWVEFCDSGADFMEVLIDNDQVWLIDGNDVACGGPGYAQVSVDVSAYADGAEHEISFHAETFSANLDSSDFHLDDIELIKGPLEPIPSRCERLAGSLGLVKTATPQTYSEAGQVIQYGFELTNSSGITVYPPYAIDDDLTVDESCPGTPASLAPGQSVQCSASYTITADDITAGSVTNRATGSAFDAPAGGNPVGSNTAEATVTYVDPSQEVIFSDSFESLP